MDDYIGGRFSSTSAVGGAVLSLAFGPEVFAQFLDGAAAEDKLSLNKNIKENPEMLDALIGVYERNVLGYPSTAVLPYSQALSRFPAHLQQLDMESNGKSVNRFGEPVDYDRTGYLRRAWNKRTALLLSASSPGNRYCAASVRRIQEQPDRYRCCDPGQHKPAETLRERSCSDRSICMW